MMEGIEKKALTLHFAACSMFKLNMDRIWINKDEKMVKLKDAKEDINAVWKEYHEKGIESGVMIKDIQSKLDASVNKIMELKMLLGNSRISILHLQGDKHPIQEPEFIDRILKEIEEKTK